MDENSFVWKETTDPEVFECYQSLCLWYYGCLFKALNFKNVLDLKRPGASLVPQMVKNLPAMQETRAWFPGQEDPLQKAMAIHFSILACRIPWTEKPGRLQSTVSQRVGYDWVTNTFTFRERVQLEIRNWCWGTPNCWHWLGEETSKQTEKTVKDTGEFFKFIMLQWLREETVGGE